MERDIEDGGREGLKIFNAKDAKILKRFSPSLTRTRASNIGTDFITPTDPNQHCHLKNLCVLCVKSINLISTTTATERQTLPKIAILIPAEDYEEDWSVLEADYRRLFGDSVTFRRWTEPGDLSGFDLVSPLIAWGYHRDLPRWLVLLDWIEAEGIKTSNPVGVLRWNSDKNYLFELADQDVPIVPTRSTYELGYDDLVFIRECCSCDKLVIKPPVSGGADGTYLLNLVDPIPANALGKPMLVQPYFPTIATEGEYSLFYFGGNFSHSIIKRPATGDFRVQDQFGGYEEAVDAPKAATALAQSALAATAEITGTGVLAYARVDMLRDDAGAFRLMELELIEPSLFLQFAADKGEAFAKTICCQNLANDALL